MDYQLVKKYDRLKQSESGWRIFFRIYFEKFIPFAILLWLSISLMYSILGLPKANFHLYGNEFLVSLNSQHNWLWRWIVFLENSWQGILFMIVIALAFGVVGYLRGGIGLGVTYFLGGGQPIGLAFGLAAGFLAGLLAGVIVGVTYGLALSEIVSLSWRSSKEKASNGIIGGVLGGVVLGSSVIISLSLGYGTEIDRLYLILCTAFSVIIFLIFHFRLYLLIGQIGTKVSLRKNPYLFDEKIYIPLPKVDYYLIEEARQDAMTGKRLANFLLAYRPLQTELAYQLIHVCTASEWEFSPLQASAIRFPKVTSIKGRFDYPQAWINQMEHAKAALRAAESADQTPKTKLLAWERFYESWSDFEEVVRQPTYKQWNLLYLDTVLSWKNEVEKKIGLLREEVKRRNPVADPIFKPGKPLDPKIVDDRDLFLGRNDLRESLINRLYGTGYIRRCCINITVFIHKAELSLSFDHIRPVFLVEKQAYLGLS